MTHHLPDDAALLDPVDPHTDDEAVADARQRRLILITMCVSLIAVIASSSGLNVAQQALAADIGATRRLSTFLRQVCSGISESWVSPGRVC